MRGRTDGAPIMSRACAHSGSAQARPLTDGFGASALRRLDTDDTAHNSSCAAGASAKSMPLGLAVAAGAVPSRHVSTPFSLPNRAQPATGMLESRVAPDPSRHDVHVSVSCSSTQPTHERRYDPSGSSAEFSCDSVSHLSVPPSLATAKLPPSGREHVLMSSDVSTRLPHGLAQWLHSSSVVAAPCSLQPAHESR